MRFDLGSRCAYATNPPEPDMTMRFCWPFLAVALVAATPSWAAGAVERDEPDIDMYAHISGKCTTLRIAGRDFGCKAVAYFHGQQGRAHFTIVLATPGMPATSSRSPARKAAANRTISMSCKSTACC